MTKNLIIFLIVCHMFSNISGQVYSVQPFKMYKLHYKYEIPLSTSLFALDYYIFSKLLEKPVLNTMQIKSLNINTIWSFDRRAVNQTYEKTRRERALLVSDWSMNIAVALPSLLLLDNRIRADWYDIFFLYVESQAVNLLLAYSGPLFTDRKRPIVYIHDAPLNEKINQGNTNSFFSGHTSTTAVASFFMAKIISDYNPELGVKKWFLFAAAIIPPTFVGYHRYRGFKHFPTDIVTGTIVGAAVGIFTPHLHKNKSRKNINIVPFTGYHNGVAIKIKF